MTQRSHCPSCRLLSGCPVDDPNDKADCDCWEAAKPVVSGLQPSLAEGLHAIADAWSAHAGKLGAMQTEIDDSDSDRLLGSAIVKLDEAESLVRLVIMRLEM